MHNAPAVSYPAGRSSFALAAMSIVWFFSAAGIVSWSLQSALARGSFAIALLAWLAAGAIALRGWIRSPTGMLSWDGQGWTWVGRAGEGQGGMPEVALDTQRALLLRWQGEAARAQWLWLERGAQPARWDDLRRAVYSRARPEALAGTQAAGETRP